MGLMGFMEIMGKPNQPIRSTLPNKPIRHIKPISPNLPKLSHFSKKTSHFSQKISHISKEMTAICPHNP